MKTTKKNILHLPKLLFFLLIMTFVACSVEDNPNVPEELVDLNAEVQLKGGPNHSTVEEQLAFLTKRMRKFHNIQAANAQGWDELIAVIPLMGFHYLNFSHLDDTFDMLNPEILVYVPDENGVMQFVAAEYAVVGQPTDDPPEGFIGEEDEWVYVPPLQSWTLHAWVGMYNPDGVFNPTNPDVILP